MTFTTVIFDLDGTLLNTLEDLATSANLVCQAHGWPTFSREEYKLFVGNGMPKLVERFTPPSLRSPALLEKALGEYLEVYARHREDHTAPYPGIPSLLAQLGRAGIPVGVLSNKDDGPAKAVMAHYLPGLTDQVQGRVEGIPAKPDPSGLFLLMERLGADPDRTLFVGDSGVDIETAHNGRLPACGVLWGFRGRAELTQAGAEYLAGDTEELLAIIRGERS